MIPLRLKLFGSLRGRLYPDDPEIGDLPMLFLLYLSFLLLPLFIQRSTATDWTPTVLATLLFLPMYFWGWWRPRQLPGLALTMNGLALLLLPFNPGASTLAIYALAQAADVRSFKLSVALALIILLSFGLMVWLLGLPLIVLFVAVVPGLAVWFGNRSFRDAQRRRAILTLSQEEIRRLGELAERERIARDLHDLLGHTLSVVVLKTELARKLLERAPERALAEIIEVEALARRSLDEVRQTVRGIRRASLQQEYAQSRLALEAAGVRSQLAHNDIDVPAGLESALAFALREAVTNIVRHAQASHMQVELQKQGRFLTMDIRDNGRGGLQRHGQGLTGMAERIEALDGTLEIDSPRGRGTRLFIQLPLPAPTAEAAQLPAAWQDALR